MPAACRPPSDGNLARNRRNHHTLRVERASSWLSILRLRLLRAAQHRVMGVGRATAWHACVIVVPVRRGSVVAMKRAFNRCGDMSLRTA